MAWIVGEPSRGVSLGRPSLGGVPPCGDSRLESGVGFGAVLGWLGGVIWGRFGDLSEGAILGGRMRLCYYGLLRAGAGGHGELSASFH